MNPVLETERLILDKWTVRDADALYEYAKNPNVGPHAGWKPHETVAESRNIIRGMFRKSITWKMILKETGKVIGSISLEEDRHRPELESKELGYSLSEDYWGQGITTEAGHAVLEYAFNVLNLRIVSIQTAPNNHRSQHVIGKLGFKSEGLMRYTYPVFDGTIRDSLMYSILKEEWEEFHKEDGVAPQEDKEKEAPEVKAKAAPKAPKETKEINEDK